ncbi:1510_t:CDS:2, partial [Dentiscutata heterogama]
MIQDMQRHRKPRICYECRRLGHNARSCPHQTQRKESNNDEYEIGATKVEQKVDRGNKENDDQGVSEFVDVRSIKIIKDDDEGKKNEIIN